MAEENKSVESGCDPSSCATCPSASNCGSAKPAFDPANKASNIKHVIAVMSGKGGVGKSFVSASLAVDLKSKGYNVGILDADITGPSIPKMFGVKNNITGTDDGIIPGETATGIRVMSVNLLLEHDDDPVVWRGPVIAGVIKQFWGEVVWGDLDYLIIDMPPGTGDVPLTVFQSIPVDGTIIVTSPQDLVKMIVGKSVNMAKKMDIPILGVVENYSYLECPDCGKHIPVFGESKIDEIAAELGIDVLGKMPIMTKSASLADKGAFDLSENKYIEDATNKLIKLESE